MTIRRRDFITLLGGAAVAWPLAARAQQPGLPVIGFLNASSPEPSADVVAAFRKGLSEAGYVEGKNVAIEYRWANDDYSRLPELAADLVRRHVAVIATPSGSNSTPAAKAATTTIPIVFQFPGDPVQTGLVASFNRPGGNVTGITSMNVELMPKRLGLLHELVPGAARFGALVNPNSASTELTIKELQAAASGIGRQIEILAAGTNNAIDMAFANLVEKRVDALLVTAHTLFIERRIQLATLTARHAVPAIYSTRENVDAGGLMSYGTSLTDQYRQVGIYTGRILKGEKPADLPVLLATKFEFIINLQTAKVLGITIRATILAQADEVIE